MNHWTPIFGCLTWLPADRALYVRKDSESRISLASGADSAIPDSRLGLLFREAGSILHEQ